MHQGKTRIKSAGDYIPPQSPKSSMPIACREPGKKTKPALTIGEMFTPGIGLNLRGRHN